MPLTIGLKLESPELERIAIADERIAAALERLVALLDRPPMPGPFYASITSQGVDGMLNFSIVGIVAPVVKDVATRELSVQVGIEAPTVSSIALDATEVSGFAGLHNDSVIASLTDTDAAGNRSVARELSTVLLDTIAPPQPGEFGIRVDSET